MPEIQDVDYEIKTVMDRSIHSLQIRVVEDNSKLKPDGRKGEIWFESASCSSALVREFKENCLKSKRLFNKYSVHIWVDNQLYSIDGVDPNLLEVDEELSEFSQTAALRLASTYSKKLEQDCEFLKGIKIDLHKEIELNRASRDAELKSFREARDKEVKFIDEQLAAKREELHKMDVMAAEYVEMLSEMRLKSMDAKTVAGLYAAHIEEKPDPKTTIDAIGENVGKILKLPLVDQMLSAWAIKNLGGVPGVIP